MNLTLKAKIVEKFGFQWKFAQAADVHESIVARVIRGRRELSEEQKRTWAELLGCRAKDILDAPNR